MTQQKLSVIRQLAQGLAWPLVLELLEDCVASEERYALRSKNRDEAAENVFRAQGARALMNRFVAAATETEETDGGTSANG